MLKDCIEIFKKTRSEYLSKSNEHNKITFITDDYPLSYGSYILVDDKTGKIKKYLEVRKDSPKDTEYRYFANLDYLSSLIDMNKPIDMKKVIHSNNIYSFFIKKDSLEDKLKKERIDDYYSNLLNPNSKYKNDKKKLNLYLEIEKRLGKVNVDDVVYIKSWIEDNILNKNISDINNRLKEDLDIDDSLKADKSYLKIFFDFPLENFEKECEKYTIPNIYNKNDFNVEIDNVIYGLPNNNINLNSKKVFLKNMSRKNTEPYLIDSSEVLDQKYFFDYLMSFLGRRENNIYLSFEGEINGYKEFPEKSKSGYFLRVNKGTEPEIVDLELLKEKELNIKINNRDLFNLPYKGDIPDYYKTITNENVLQKLINDIFYENCLTTNYFNSLKDITLPKHVVISKDLLGQSKNIWEDLFFKKNETLLKANFEKVGLKIIKNTILNNKTIKPYEFKACEQFSLYISICKYIFNREEDMKVIANNIFDSLSEKINSNITKEINSDEEYFMAAGQLAKYFISLSKSAEKKHSLINPIINCKNPQKLKDELQKLFKKYNYRIDSNSKRFNNLYGMILAYDCTSKINEKYLMLGYLFNSLIYFKEEN